MKMFFDNRGRTGFVLDENDSLGGGGKGGLVVAIISVIVVLIMSVGLIISFIPTGPACPNCGHKTELIDKHNEYNCPYFGECNHTLYHCPECWEYYTNLE
jgi:DNA-directed RNA polymerase subunit RPC12/RpoP